MQLQTGSQHHRASGAVWILCEDTVRCVMGSVIKSLVGYPCCLANIHPAVVVQHITEPSVLMQSSGDLTGVHWPASSPEDVLLADLRGG
ncbi:hypothetical protein VZT92_019667 [Zoarces viviparus]|uniref:Uncharacterized protein n=1 Tax=Zoarces viviparus TaxID=48416 RepID=A0AAW1EKX1_ZOAVI